jgi:hypothetical protein
MLPNAEPSGCAADQLNARHLTSRMITQAVIGSTGKSARCLGTPPRNVGRDAGAMMRRSDKSLVIDAEPIPQLRCQPRTAPWPSLARSRRWPPSPPCPPCACEATTSADAAPATCLGMFVLTVASECTHPPCPWRCRYRRQRDHFVPSSSSHILADLPDTRVRHRPLKPFACGNTGYCGGLVVTNSHVFLLHARLRVLAARPVFPAPSIFRGRNPCTTRAQRAAGMRTYVIARSPSDEAIFGRGKVWIASLALAMTGRLFET